MDAIIKSRIDLDLKTEVERVLAALGLTVSDAIRMTFKQIAARQGLPFDVKIPNAQTQAAMRDADEWVAAMRAGSLSAPSQSIDTTFAELSKPV
jgi:DNA-damage-inducible protein J